MTPNDTHSKPMRASRWEAQLPPPSGGMHPGAVKKYNEIRDSMLNVLERVETEDKQPQKAAVYADRYRVMLSKFSEYSKDANRGLVNAMRQQPNGLPMSEDTQMMLENGYRNQFLMSFNGIIDSMEADERKQSGIRFQPGTMSTTRQAFYDLGREMNGPGIVETLLGSVYDRKVARETGSSLKAVRWGGLAGGILGFMMAGKFAGGGLAGLLMRLGVALGGLWGGSKLQNYLMGSDGKGGALSSFFPGAAKKDEAAQPEKDAPAKLKMKTASVDDTPDAKPEAGDTLKAPDVAMADQSSYRFSDVSEPGSEGFTPMTTPTGEAARPDSTRNLS